LAHASFQSSRAHVNLRCDSCLCEDVYERGSCHDSQLVAAIDVFDDAFLHLGEVGFCGGLVARACAIAGAICLRGESDAPEFPYKENPTEPSDERTRAHGKAVMAHA